MKRRESYVWCFLNKNPLDYKCIKRRRFTLYKLALFFTQFIQWLIKDGSEMISITNPRMSWHLYKSWIFCRIDLNNNHLCLLMFMISSPVDSLLKTLNPNYKASWYSNNNIVMPVCGLSIFDINQSICITIILPSSILAIF